MPSGHAVQPHSGPQGPAESMVQLKWKRCPSEKLPFPVSSRTQDLGIVISNALRNDFQMMCETLLIRHRFPGLFPAVLLLWVFLLVWEHMSSAQGELALWYPLWESLALFSSSPSLCAPPHPSQKEGFTYPDSYHLPPPFLSWKVLHKQLV